MGAESQYEIDKLTKRLAALEARVAKIEEGRTLWNAIAATNDRVDERVAKIEGRLDTHDKCLIAQRQDAVLLSNRICDIEVGGAGVSGAQSSPPSASAAESPAAGATSSPAPAGEVEDAEAFARRLKSEVVDPPALVLARDAAVRRRALDDAAREIESHDASRHGVLFAMHIRALSEREGGGK